MKVLIAGFLILSSTVSAEALDYDINAVISHAATSYVNRGICSAMLDYELDAGDERILGFELGVVAKDKSGKLVLAETLFSGSSDMIAAGGKTWGKFYIEDEDVCGSEDWILQIISAKLKLQGDETINLIEKNALRVSDFKPMQIKIGD